MKNCSCPRFFWVLILFAFGPVQGQYFYKDIVSHHQNHDKFARMKQARVTAVTVRSFEASGEPSEGFQLNQVVNSSFTQVKTSMEVPYSGHMGIVNYYHPDGTLYKTLDSGYQTVSVYAYGYDSLQRLVSIEQQVQALGEKQKTTEWHRWEYDEKGAPLRMVRNRGGADSTIIQLHRDSLGRVIEEYPIVQGKAGEKTYYYYDADGRLSDIVRYNTRAGKLSADYMFDYYPNGQLRQMVTIEQASLQQTTWIYLYDENQLVSEEKCYNAQKKLAGRMAYQYVLRK